jgi:predicted amidophosphoribosyltransferase
MTQPTFNLEKQEPPLPAGPYVLKFSTKVSLVVVLLGILWLRLTLRRRSKDRICSHCGQRNPRHQGHCRKCSAPLFGS